MWRRVGAGVWVWVSKYVRDEVCLTPNGLCIGYMYTVCVCGGGGGGGGGLWEAVLMHCRPLRPPDIPPANQEHHFEAQTTLNCNMRFQNS